MGKNFSIIYLSLELTASSNDTSRNVTKRHLNDIHSFSRISAKCTSRCIMCPQTLAQARAGVATPD